MQKKNTNIILDIEENELNLFNKQYLSLPELHEEIEKLFEEGNKIDKRKKKVYNEWKEKYMMILLNLFTQYFSNISYNMLFTRFYAETKEDVCRNINEFGDDVKMVVVGHCPTHDYFKSFMKTHQPYYLNCDMRSQELSVKGCIVTKCDDIQNPGAPRLAFVDTGISSAFRYTGINAVDIKKASFQNIYRHNEMLHLHHDDKLGGTNRYYNKILRYVLPNVVPHKFTSNNTSYPPHIDMIDLPIVGFNIRTEEANTKPHEIVLYKALPKEEHRRVYQTHIKYLKYKLKYFYLLKNNN